eukprot:351773-Chlamydomonas_euryale.AAC.19
MARCMCLHASFYHKGTPSRCPDKLKATAKSLSCMLVVAPQVTFPLVVSAQLGGSVSLSGDPSDPEGLAADGQLDLESLVLNLVAAQVGSACHAYVGGQQHAAVRPPQLLPSSKLLTVSTTCVVFLTC